MLVMGFETSCDETAVAILRKQSKSSKVEKKVRLFFHRFQNTPNMVGLSQRLQQENT